MTTIQGLSNGIAWEAAGGGIGRITLARPEHANTIGLAQGHAFAQAVDAVLGAEPRVVVLTGTGRIFCAGGAIDEMSGAEASLDQLIAGILAPLHPAIERLSRAPLPVLAQALAQRLATAATGSLARIKQLCDGTGHRSLREHLDLECDLLLQASREPDATEGLRAFLDKRKPTFGSG